MRYEMGDAPGAIAEFQRVIEKTPSFYQAYFNLGLTYIAINDKPAATAQYETLKGLDADLAKQLYDAIKH